MANYKINKHGMVVEEIPEDLEKEKEDLLQMESLLLKMQKNIKILSTLVIRKKDRIEKLKKEKGETPS